MARNIKKIIFTTDLSETSWKALDDAVLFAEKFGAELAVLTVVDDLSGFSMEGLYSAGNVFANLDEIRAKIKVEAKKSIEKKVAALPPSIRRSIHVVEGDHPPTVLQEQIEKLGGDLVVMATHGRRGLAHALIGSTAERLVRILSVPVLTIRVG